MAQFETWLKSDLQQPVKVIPICGNVFTQDNMANRVGVEVYDGGEAVTLSGTVQGCIIRADDATVIQTGSLSGNKAWVDLPESAYAIPGQIQIAIRLVSGDTKTVLGACTSFVSRSVTGSIVDPGHVIPSIDELLALIDDMEDAIAASENVNISQSKSGNTVTIVTTNRNGVATTTQLHDGADGEAGPAGPGVPTGGTTGQVLKKASGTDYDTEWANESGGGGSVTVDDTLSISGDAADAAKVGEVKADLESDISDLSLRLDRYYPAFTLGALDVSNGGEASATNRMRTGFIPTKNAVALVALEYKVYVVYYDKFRHFAANGGGWVSGVANINQVYPYFRLLIANDNISNFTNKTENRTIVTIDTTAKSVDDRIDTLQSYVNGYYPAIVVAMMNVTNGGINFDPVTRATSEIVSGKYRYITAASGYSYYICYYNSSLTFVKNSGGWKTGTNELEDYPYIRLLFKNDSISDWTGLTNTFCYLEVEKSDKQHVYTIGQNDNVAQVLTEAMKYRGSVVYIEPYEHDCITEWQTFYGSNYFTNMSSGEGLGLTNDIHIIGRSGHKLKCWYTGSNNYVMEHFSLFNNPHGGSGYTLENVCIDTKKIRYCVHDERGSDTVPYKVRFKHCVMSQDQTGSTWDRSRACIGGGLGMSADIVVEDCIFNTVTSTTHLDSLAYHNSDANGAAANAQSNVVIKNCYCAGNSTIQLMHHGASTRKTPVLVANCSMGSAMEIIDNQSGTNNLEIYQINNTVRV